LHSSTLIRLLEQKGWKLVRTHGSHFTFKHPQHMLIGTVPHPKKDLPTGTVRNILRTAGL